MGFYSFFDQNFHRSVLFVYLKLLLCWFLNPVGFTQIDVARLQRYVAFRPAVNILDNKILEFQGFNHLVKFRHVQLPSTLQNPFQIIHLLLVRNFQIVIFLYQIIFGVQFSCNIEIQVFSSDYLVYAKSEQCVHCFDLIFVFRV